LKLQQTFTRGKKAVDNVRQIPLPGNTTKGRCRYISQDLLKQVQKLQSPQSFRIHLDVITDIPDEVQLIVYCRVADEEKKIFLEHHLYCLNVVGVCATAQAISDKFNQFIEERGLDWKKCKSVTTDGEAAMQASPNGCYTKYKNRFP